MEKTCSKCGRTLPLDCFHRHKGRKDDRSSTCKECAIARARQHYRDNKEAVLSRRREYYLENKEAAADKRRAYRAANREALVAKDKEYYRANREEIAHKNKAYREANRERIAVRKREDYKAKKEHYTAYYKQYRTRNREAVAAKDKKYREANKERLAERRKIYRRENSAALQEQRRKRVQTDVQFRLAGALRNRIRSALKNKQKTGSAVRDLGCSIAEFKEYLESRFEPGMSWDNWSRHGWHIDHTIPLSYFDLTDPVQFAGACHYTNTRPVWAKENLSKGAKVC